MITLLPLLFFFSDPAPAPRQPHLAAARGQVAMTFGAGGSIYYSQPFPDRIKVADVGALALGRHRGPRLAILKDAMVITAIAGEQKATELVAWRSVDRGRTWTRAGIVNDVPESAREGLHALAANPAGSLFAVWLDLRAKGTRLYGSWSRDGGATWSKNVMVYESPDGTICQCCAPSVTFDERGRLWVMWRNVMDGSRDLYTAASNGSGGFEPAMKLGAGTWKINACPMDGGGFAVRNGKVFSAWRRESDVFLSTTDGEEKRLGPGKDVALALGKRGPVVAWTDGAGLKVMTPGAAAPRELAAEGAFVSLIALEDGRVLAAWETKGSIVTEHIE